MPYGREGTNVFLLCLCHCTSWFCSFCSPSIPALSPRILFLLPPSNQSPQSGLGPLLLSGPYLFVTLITLQGYRGSQISSPQVRLWGSVIHPQFLLETQSASPLHFQGALLLPPVTVPSTCRAISHPPAPAGPGGSPEALASGLCSPFPWDSLLQASQSAHQCCQHLPTASRTQSLKLRFLFFVLCSHPLPRAPRISPLV